MAWSLDVTPFVSNSNIHRLRRAWRMSYGGPSLSHTEMRMLEKKKLVVIYTLKDGTELPVLTAKGHQSVGRTGFEPREI